MSLFRNRNKTIEDGLRKQLGDLEYKPSDSLWERIGGELTEDGFERKIQTKTDEFELIPYPETWGKIEAELPEERVSRPLFSRWGYAALLLLFMTGLYAGYLWRNTGKPAAVVLNKETSAPNNTIPSFSRPMKNNARIPENSNQVQSDTRRQERATTKTAAHDNRQAQQGSKTLATASPDQPSQKLVTDKNNRSAKTRVKSTSSPVVASAVTARKAKEETTHTSNDQSVNSSIPAAIEKNTSAATVLPETEAQNTIKTDSSALAKTIAPAGNNTVTTDSLKTIVAQPAVAASALTPPAPAMGDISGEELSHYSITAMAGIQYCFTRLSAPSSSSLDFSKNIALRESIEKPSIDWSGLFMIDYMINNHWRVSAGIGMLNFSQQFYYNITTPSKPPSGSEPGASTINTNDSIVAGNNYSTRIKYTWTEIPLLVTYSFNHKNKFGFELQGGISYAMISSVDAGMVSYDNIGVLVLKDKNAFPGIKNNFFLQLNPAITYQVNNQITLSVMPTFKYSLNSMINNENWVQQYPYFLGASVSLRRRF